MIITISGMPGSGKSSVGKLLAKMLGMKRYYMGGMRREMAREKGMTLAELNRIGEKEDWTDKEVDEYQKELGKKEDNFVIEGRTSFFLIPNSVKVFLEVDEKVGAARILKDLRETGDKRNEGVEKNLEEVESSMKQRIGSDIKRYKKYYGVDITDRSHYDLIINTTKLTVEQVVGKIIEFVKKK